MSLEQFIAAETGQSPLYAPSAAREYLRGQCVQLVALYASQVLGTPVMWQDAANWWYNFSLGAFFDKIPNNPNDPNQVPPRGAIVIFSEHLPGSGGAGHIDICLSANPGAATWVGFDSNWGGKTAHNVTHNWSYVLGWLVRKGAAPAPANPQGDEMIANETQAHQAYKLLRPNGDGNPDEIAGTAGKRSWQQFANDAQTEVSQRDANIRAQNDQLSAMQGTINTLNQTVTQISSQDAADKDQLKAALDKVAELTSELETSHDQLKDLHDALPTPTPGTVPAEAQAPTDGTALDPSPLTKFFLAILKLGSLRKAKK